MGSLLRAKKGKSNLTVCFHKQEDVLTESFPKIVPLYDGQELQINQNLVMDGLATISIRNMKTKKFNIEKRNSFFNLHRPELKGLNIVPTENRSEKILHQRILKEVKTIYRTKSMKSFCKNDGPQISQHASKLSKNVENKVKSECGLLMETHFQKKLAAKTFDQLRDDLVDSSETEPDESTLESDRLCVHEVETKSTLID